MQGKKGVLLKNTIMLYILQFSTYLLAFIVVPYETRVLGPTVYGKLGVATAIMADATLLSPAETTFAVERVVRAIVAAREGRRPAPRMIFKVFIRIVILDAFYRSHSIVDRVFIPCVRTVLQAQFDVLRSHLVLASLMRTLCKSMLFRFVS